jgi:hypothetical protein
MAAPASDLADTRSPALSSETPNPRAIAGRNTDIVRCMALRTNRTAAR